MPVSERVKGARSVERAWGLFRLGLRKSTRAKYCLWFLCWFSLWNLAVVLSPVHPLIIGLTLWLPTTLLVIKLADV
jgi:hypothetical protein